MKLLRQDGKSGGYGKMIYPDTALVLPRSSWIYFVNENLYLIIWVKLKLPKVQLCALRSFSKGLCPGVVYPRTPRTEILWEASLEASGPAIHSSRWIEVTSSYRYSVLVPMMLWTLALACFTTATVNIIHKSLMCGTKLRKPNYSLISPFLLVPSTHA